MPSSSRRRLGGFVGSFVSLLIAIAVCAPTKIDGTSVRAIAHDDWDDDEELSGEERDAIRDCGDRTPGRIASAGWYRNGFAIHGVDGDERLLFVVAPSHTPDQEHGVLVSHRLTGRHLGMVAEPPGGFLEPTSIQIERYTTRGSRTEGVFIINDNGGPPALAGMVPTLVHRYRYAYSRRDGFRSQWLETHRLPFGPPPPPGTLPTGIVYTAGFLRVPSGQTLVNDTALGAIWIDDGSLDHWRLAVMDPDLFGGHCDDIAGVGRAPGGGTRHYKLQTPFNLCPGVHSMTHVALTDEVCVNRTTPPGGIFCWNRETLLDATIPPPIMGTLKRALVPPAPGLSDLGDGVTYDRYHPDSRWLYFARSPADAAVGFANTIWRVDVRTGAVQVVVRDNQLLDWTSNIAALPPLFPTSRTTIFASVGQEENNPEVNVLLNGQPQFVVPVPLPLIDIER